jgi:hypothetical protein
MECEPKTSVVRPFVETVVSLLPASPTATQDQPLSVFVSPGAGARVAAGPLVTDDIPEAGLVEQATVVKGIDCV